MKKITEKLNKLFEQEEQTLPSFLELQQDTWESLKKFASSKGYTLDQYALYSEDGKELVNLESENPWKQILTYLELEDLEGEPTRSLLPKDITTTVQHPEANQNQVVISGNMENEDLPQEGDVREIIDANLAVNDAEIQGDLDIQKSGGRFVIRFNITKPTDVTNDEIKSGISQNLDKILNIQDVEVR